jgi:hypothetical protein
MFSRNGLFRSPSRDDGHESYKVYEVVEGWAVHRLPLRINAFISALFLNKKALHCSQIDHLASLLVHKPLIKHFEGLVNRCGLEVGKDVKSMAKGQKFMENRQFINKKEARELTPKIILAFD